MDGALAAMRGLPAPGAEYLLPFGARSRFLFKMDFAEAEYISRLRSGVKGHFKVLGKDTSTNKELVEAVVAILKHVKAI